MQQNSNYYLQCGLSKKVNGDLYGAIIALDDAIKCRPNFEEALFYRAKFMNEAGNFKEAILNYNKVIEINPRNANAFNNRGNIKKELLDYSGAIEDYKAALKIKPEFIVARNNLSTVLSTMSSLSTKQKPEYYAERTNLSSVLNQKPSKTLMLIYVIWCSLHLLLGIFSFFGAHLFDFVGEGFFPFVGNRYQEATEFNSYTVDELIIYIFVPLLIYKVWKKIEYRYY